MFKIAFEIMLSKYQIGNDWFESKVKRSPEATGANDFNDQTISSKQRYIEFSHETFTRPCQLCRPFEKPSSWEDFAYETRNPTYWRFVYQLQKYALVVVIKVQCYKSSRSLFKNGRGLSKVFFPKFSKEWKLQILKVAKVVLILLKIRLPKLFSHLMFEKDS